MSRTRRAFAPGGVGRRFLPRLLPIALGLAAVGLSVPSYGAASGPDFSGLWRRPSFAFAPPFFMSTGRNDRQVVGGHKNPILKPWVAEILIVKLHSDATGRPAANTNTACWPDGVPGVYTISEMQILQKPDKITILHTDDQDVRYVHMNSEHPRPLKPTWFGHSVGHFEGNTLVVDTRGFPNRPEAMIDHYGTPVTDGLHVVERFNMLDNGKRLTVDFTVEDPNVFKKPWSMKIDYNAKEGVLAEYRCGENNRDWFDLMPIAQKPDF